MASKANKNVKDDEKMSNPGLKSKNDQKYSQTQREEDDRSAGKVAPGQFGVGKADGKMPQHSKR